MVLCGIVAYDMVWYSMVWHGMVWYGMVWYGIVWYGMVWYAMLWYGIDDMLSQYGAVCESAQVINRSLANYLQVSEGVQVAVVPYRYASSSGKGQHSNTMHRQVQLDLNRFSLNVGLYQNARYFFMIPLSVQSCCCCVRHVQVCDAECRVLLLLCAARQVCDDECRVVLCAACVSG